MLTKVGYTGYGPVTRKGGLVCGEKALGSENPLMAQLPDAGYTLAQDSHMVCLR